MLLSQILNSLILAGWLVGAVVALILLRRCRMVDVARVLWVIVIMTPILGALAFFIVNPGRPERSPGESTDHQ